MKQVALKLPLNLDKEAVKQLDKVKKLTNHKTSTKAIVEALYKFEYYQKQFNQATQKIEALTLQLDAQKRASRNFLQCFDELRTINETKQSAEKGKTIKGKKNLQLILE